MPDITNGEAITFVESQLRPAADAFAQAYYRVTVAYDEWITRNLGALFPATTDLVLDQNQFAHPLTSNDVLVLVGVLNTFLESVDANNKANLAATLKAAVNPQR